MNWYKKAQEIQWVYHNTRKENLPGIKETGLEAGSFSNRPINFGGDIWLAVSRSIFPDKTQEHEYGRDKKGTIIAIEPPYGNFIVKPEDLYLADKKGKILGKL
jgi:hypothetical protein